MPSVAGTADLPSWMHLRHPKDSSLAFLYGSAPNQGELDIELIAINKFNYDTQKTIIRFKVTEIKSKYLSFL